MRSRCEYGSMTAGLSSMMYVMLSGRGMRPVYSDSMSAMSVARLRSQYGPCSVGIVSPGCIATVNVWSRSCMTLLRCRESCASLCGREDASQSRAGRRAS